MTARIMSPCNGIADSRPPARARHLSSPSVTAHRCPHIGYDDFNPPSWPSDCAPDKDAWVTYGYREPEAICGTMTSYHSINYPEEFWNCSDIKIEAGECMFECILRN